MQQLMREMALVPFLFITGFLLAMAAVAIFAGLHARSRAALVKSMPTSNIGMAQEGYCEFEGTIEAIGGAQVIAPLTLTPCAWYHAKLEKWDAGARNRTATWQTVRESTSGSPLLLRDATGVCIVFPYGGGSDADRQEPVDGRLGRTHRSQPAARRTDRSQRRRPSRCPAAPTRASATAKSGSTSAIRCSCWENSRRVSSNPTTRDEDDEDEDEDRSDRRWRRGRD